jgi:hypothetical protein
MFKSRRNPFNSRALSVERLEDRQLMAADVGAYVQNGALFVVESAGWPGGQNGVQIMQVAPGTMRVTGLQTDDGGTSHVNGHASQDFSGINSLFVNLGGGNDRVYIGRSAAGTTLGDVFINVDGTNGPNAYQFDYDKVIVENLTTTGTLDIRTGVGNDYIAVGNSKIGNDDLDNLNIYAGAGSDTLYLTNVDVKGNLAVLTSDSHSTSADADQVNLQTVTTHAGLSVLMGSGKDTLNATDVTSSTSILFDTGAGNDTVSLNSVRATDDFFARMGDGDDTLKVTYLRANRLTLDGGAGKDSLTTGIDGTVNLLSEINWELINGKVPLVFKPLAGK